MKFDKYYNVYDNYSIVQKKVAENLSNFIKNSGIENKKIETIFEIGCGTGIFTKKYITGNLAEIKNHFGISLDYHDVNFIKDILKKYFSNVNFYDEEMILEFDSPMSLLKHLKYTGVTGFQKVNSVSKIRSFKDKKLTYKVAYFVCDK